MMCLAIGLGVLGFVAMRRARRCHAYGGCGHHWHGGHWGARSPRHWMLYRALAHIDATPAQERFIVGELDKLRAAVRDASGKLADARGPLSSAIRGDQLDDAALAATLANLDGAHADVRAAALAALRAIHGVLDERQRSRVADLLDRRGWWRSGPYR